MQLDSETGQGYYTQINKELLYTVKGESLSRDSQGQAEKATVDIFFTQCQHPHRDHWGKALPCLSALPRKALPFTVGLRH